MDHEMRKWLYYNLALEVFTQRNYVADFIRGNKIFRCFVCEILSDHCVLRMLPGQVKLRDYFP